MIGKRISVPIPARDNRGRIIPNKFVRITGVCYSIGYNDVLKCNHVTIGRYPVYPIDLSLIELI